MQFRTIITSLFVSVLITGVSLANDIMIKDQYARATMPGMPVAGAFMQIINEGAEDDRLVRAESPVSKTTEVHEMEVVEDVMKMREMADGLPIPSKTTVELKPGSYHVMFIGLNEPLLAGENYPVTLFFEKAGQIEISVPAKNMMKMKMQHQN